MSFKRTDLIETMLREEAAADHAQADRRASRAERVAQCAVRAMQADGMMVDVERAEAAIFDAVCDEFFENKAIDIPRRRTAD